MRWVWRSVMISARPRAEAIMAKVAMNGTIFPKETMMPFSSPQTAPTRIATTTNNILSVGAVMALASVRVTTVSTQVLSNDPHWMWLVVVAILVAAARELLSGRLVSFGDIVR